MTDRKDAIMYVIGKLFHYDPVMRVYRFRNGESINGCLPTHGLNGVSRDLMDDLVKQAEERQALDGHMWP